MCVCVCVPETGLEGWVCVCARVPAASAASLVVAVAVVGVVAGFAALVATVIRIELSAAWPTEAGLPGHSV